MDTTHGVLDLTVQAHAGFQASKLFHVSIGLQGKDISAPVDQSMNSTSDTQQEGKNSLPVASCTPSYAFRKPNNENIVPDSLSTQCNQEINRKNNLMEEMVSRKKMRFPLHSANLPSHHAPLDLSTRKIARSNSGPAGKCCFGTGPSDMIQQAPMDLSSNRSHKQSEANACLANLPQMYAKDHEELACTPELSSSSEAGTSSGNLLPPRPSQQVSFKLPTDTKEPAFQQEYWNVTAHFSDAIYRRTQSSQESDDPTVEGVDYPVFPVREPNSFAVSNNDAHINVLPSSSKSDSSFVSNDSSDDELVVDDELSGVTFMPDNNEILLIHTPLESSTPTASPRQTPMNFAQYVRQCQSATALMTSSKIRHAPVPCMAEEAPATIANVPKSPVIESRHGLERKLPSPASTIAYGERPSSSSEGSDSDSQGKYSAYSHAIYYYVEVSDGGKIPDIATIESMRKYKCNDCQEIIGARNAVDIHTNKHLGQVFKCKMCSKAYYSSTSAFSHYMLFHEGQKFNCTLCDFQVASCPHLHLHMQTIHMAERESIGLCKYCGESQFDKKFVKGLGMKRAIKPKKWAEENSMILCQYCSEAFHSKFTYIQHINMHHKLQKTICPVQGCSMVLAPHDILSHHRKSHGRDDRSRCPICGAIFRHTKALSQHLHGIHMNVRRYHCLWEGCNRSFKLEKHLSIHHLIHTNEKPIKCHLCPYECRQRISINLHMKKYHPDNKDTQGPCTD